MDAYDLWLDVTSRNGRQESHFFFLSLSFSIWAGRCLSQREGREKGRSAGRCKDGRATNVVR